MVCVLADLFPIMDFRLVAFLSIFLFLDVASVSSKEANVTLLVNESQVILPYGHDSGYIHGPTGVGLFFTTRISVSDLDRQIYLSLESATFNCSTDNFFVHALGEAQPKLLCVNGSLVTGSIGVSRRFTIYFLRKSPVPNEGKDPAFQLKYYACGGTLKIRGNGSIEAPSTAIVSAVSNCIWVLTDSTSTSMILDLPILNIETSANCTKDKLIVETDIQYTRLCDPKVKTKKFVGKRITIKFSVDASVSRDRSFKFDYSTCNYEHHIAAGESKFIESYGYPLTAPRDLRCMWNLKTDANHTIYLLIDELQLQATSNCSLATLTVHNPATSASTMKKYCATLSSKKAFMTSMTYSKFQDLQIVLYSLSSNATKLRLKATSLKMIRVFSNTDQLSENFTSPTFPGPVPEPLSLRYYFNNGHYIAVFLQELQLPVAASCKTNALRVSDWFGDSAKTACTSSKPGFLANYKNLVKVDFFAESASTASFKLGLEYTLGAWKQWTRTSECDVYCGIGLRSVRRTCGAPKGGCFKDDGKTRATVENRFVKCSGRKPVSSCRKTKKETWYSIEFTLRFSSSVSSKLFNETIGPAITKSLAVAVTRFCNQNPKQCCKETNKASNSESRYAFLSASDFRFTSDSPLMMPLTRLSLTEIFVKPGPVKVRIGVFAIPPKDNALCGSKGVQRRKREAPTAPDPTEGALSKKALLDATKAMKQNEMTTAVSAALQNDNANITVSVLEAFSEVRSVDPPKEPREPYEGPNYFLMIGLPVILIIVGALLYAVGKCFCSQRNSNTGSNIPMS